jgi:hypothetical protein
VLNLSPNINAKIKKNIQDSMCQDDVYLGYDHIDWLLKEPKFVPKISRCSAYKNKDVVLLTYLGSTLMCVTKDKYFIMNGHPAESHELKFADNDPQYTQIEDAVFSTLY